MEDVRLNRSSVRIPKKLPFVAFHSRTNHKERKIVKVQAAKASAAARKFTISERAKRKRDIETTATKCDGAGDNWEEISFQLPFMVNALPDITGALCEYTWKLDSATTENLADHGTVAKHAFFQADFQRPLARADIPGTACVNRRRNPLDHFDRCNSLDPFGSFSVVWKDWYDNLIYHVRTICAPDAWALFSITPSQGNELLQYIYQEAMKEPAFFYSHLLFHSDEAICRGLISRHKYYWLRQKALEELRKALDDEPRATSSGIILAIGHIMLHDYLRCSDKSAAMVHVLPYRYLIHKCGGLDNLGFPQIISQMTLLSDDLISEHAQAPPMAFPYDTKDHQLKSREMYKCFTTWFAHHEHNYSIANSVTSP